MKIYGIFDLIGEEFLGFFPAKNDNVALRMNSKLPENFGFDPKDVVMYCICEDDADLSHARYLCTLDRCAEKLNFSNNISEEVSD